MAKILIIIGFLLSFTAHAAALTLTSSAFKNLSPIPTIYTCDGENISPPLIWSNSPIKTQSFALILYNPDAPFGTYYNWILYNIPKNRTSLPQGVNTAVPNGILVGTTSSGDSIYRGPCPPNAAIHHYIFKLYALDIVLDLFPGASVDDLLTNMKDHVLDEAELVGVYNH